MLWYYLRILFSATAYSEYVATHPGVDFAAAWEKAKNPVKALLLTLGASIIGGQVDLGPKMWWVAPALLGLQGFIQKNPQLGLAPMDVTVSDVRRSTSTAGGVTATVTEAVPAVEHKP